MSRVAELHSEYNSKAIVSESRLYPDDSGLFLVFYQRSLSLFYNFQSIVTKWCNGCYILSYFCKKIARIRKKKVVIYVCRVLVSFQWPQSFVIGFASVEPLKIKT